MCGMMERMVIFGWTLLNIRITEDREPLMRTRRILWLAAAAALMLSGCEDKGYRKDKDGVTVMVRDKAGDGPAMVRVQVFGDKLLRVTATPEESFSGRKSLILVPQTRSAANGIPAAPAGSRRTRRWDRSR